VVAAVELSRARFGAQEVPYAVVARFDEFADALAGAPLSAEGPLLLTSPSSLLAPAADELRRAVRPGGTVYVLGGPLAVAELVADEIRSSGFVVERLTGATRVETAVAVGEAVLTRFGDAGQVVLARGFANEPTAAWADSVTGGAWAASVRAPVLVTPSDALHPAAAAALARWAPQRTVLLGGQVALSAQVESAVPSPIRISGADRVGTAYEIAEQLWGGVGRYVLIHGYRLDGWAFGMAAAGFAADQRAPLLLANDDDVPGPGRNRLGLGCESGPPLIDVLLIGDTSILGAGVEAAADTQDGGACPVPPPPPPPPVVLRTDGLGAVRFGDNLESVAAAMTERYGTPTYDSQWMPMLNIQLCPHAEGRILEWGRLGLIFGRGGTGDVPDGLVIWQYALPQPQFDPGYPDLSTVSGIRLGSTTAQLRAAYPDVGFDELGEGYNLWFTSYAEADASDPREGLGGNVTSTADDGVVDFMVVQLCGESV
jgi:putative cell wall-binding protein